MIGEDRLASFRIAPRALSAVLTRDLDPTRAGGLPPSLFNWKFEGLVRTQVIGAPLAIRELQEWVEACLSLEIEPVLVLAEDEELLDEDAIETLTDMGASVWDVWSPARPEDSEELNPADDDWTVERLLALPDPGVVEAYYSTATPQPVSAWPLQGDLRFWIQYGEALTHWARSAAFRALECRDLYFKTLPSDESPEVEGAEVHALDDTEILAALHADSGVDLPKRSVSVRRLPFVYDLHRGGKWQSFGRLPGLELRLEKARAEEFSDIADHVARIMNWLKEFFPNSLMPGQNLATHFGDINRLIAELSIRGPHGAPPNVAPSIFDLVVIASEHDSFEVRLEAVGRLSVGDTQWSVIIPRVPLLRNFAQACSVRIEGLIDPSTNAPAVREIVLPALEGDEYPFGTIEANIAVDGFRPASDDLLGPLITLILEGRRIDCMVRPS